MPRLLASLFRATRLPSCGLLLLAALLAAGPGAAAEPPRVVVSGKPMHSLVARLMEGIAEPTLLVGGRNTPYGYRLTREQERQVAEADLVIWIGPELEPFLSEPVSRLEAARVMELLDSDELKVLPAVDSDERRDPFLWLDTRNALIFLDEFGRKLVAMDPERERQYRENHARAVHDISAIDRQLEYRYRDVSASPLALYHGTQQYFEQAYAAAVVARVTTDPAKVPTTADLLKARASMLDRNAACLLTEAGLPAPNLDLLTADSPIPVAELDSFGTQLEPGPDLYPKLMQANFATIRRCIGVDSGLIEVGGPQGHRDLSPVDVAPGSLSGRFMLVDHTGRTVTNADFLGKYQLIAFGYTGCPDVCPTSLAVMSAAMKRLGERADAIQPLFISVDPERDTPEVLAGYVAFFDPRLVGLTGPKQMIDHAVHDFGARYEKVPAEDGDYAMDHTAGYYLFGPNGVFLEKLAHGLSADQLAEKIGAHLR